MHPFWQRAQAALRTDVLHLQHNMEVITAAERTTTKRKHFYLQTRKTYLVLTSVFPELEISHFFLSTETNTCLWNSDM